MGLRLFLLLCPFLGGAVCVHADSAIAKVDGRRSTSLDGRWSAIVDPFDNGYYDYRYQPRQDGFFENRRPRGKSDLVEYDFDRSDTLRVPGDWNTQRERLFFYEGTVWYKRDFSYRLEPGRRLFVHFGAANYGARAYLNGRLLGLHEGGFTPFTFELTDAVLEGQNTLVVQVNNQRRREAVPTVNTDWWNYGGLTRSVQLVEVPSTFIREYFVQLRPGSDDEIAGWVRLDGPDPSQRVTIRISGAAVETTVTTDDRGYAELRLRAGLSLWSPEQPVLYDVSITSETDEVQERIGFRTLETRGHDLLLNGRPRFLRGISIHEEAPFQGGRAFSRQHAETLLGWAKELGCNFVRLAHYPHNEAMIRLADELGLMIWSEIPVYWTILWEHRETFETASRQLSEMIQRDRNRASVIIWSVANETPRDAARLEFLSHLIERARALDPTRLLAAATELSYHGSELVVDDPLAEHLDVIGANEYVGWYGGAPEDAARLRWLIRYEKPLLISEFGGGALAGYHGDPQTRWTEEYQELLYRSQLAMLREIPFVSGMSPWILMDFRSPRRLLPGIQDYWNRKGLISEQGDKKKAFFVLQSFYQQLAGREAMGQ